MMKHIIVIAGVCIALTLSVSARAQLAFWNYDDQDNETVIPAECDGQFDEVKGGTFLPSREEMREQGEKFLLSENPVERNKAGYCLIAAAIQGDIPAQYRVAQLYNKGIVLPQDELSAYKWSFIASLNGNGEADGLALLLERFMTTDDISLATNSIQSMLPSIGSRYQNELKEQKARVDEKKKKLEEINANIDLFLGLDLEKTHPFPEMESVSKNDSVISAPGAVGVPNGSIFSEKDRAK